MRAPGRIRRLPPERAAAWIVSGPLGHLYGAAADLAALWARWLAARGLRRRG